MEHLELTQVTFMTDSIRMRRASDTKISPKKKFHKLKRTVQVKRMRRNMYTVQIFISKTELELHHQFCGL
jgi:hypothetical protein